ncbi:SGNH/GDSL hydrolase family protein [Desulfobacter curvatus]|uniref:SGNH/GDSL hydrolase family protein n=1 Tax=Desulfobacter curvatus TaxID=2290 RepID=UPI0003734CDB|nr:SGNH/GDSL hydrolase family protein [Desulfobacter curvatus]
MEYKTLKKSRCNQNISGIGHMVQKKRNFAGLSKAMRIGLTVIIIVFAIVGGGTNKTLADDAIWVKTWTASPEPTWTGDFPLPTLLPFNLWNQTVRQKVRVSLGGDRLRIVLSNEYGKAPLTIESVHIALPGSEASAIETGTDTVVTFSGVERLVIPAGAPAISDPIELSVPALGEVVVSFFVPGPMPIETFHWDALEIGHIGIGNQVSNGFIHQPTETTTRIFLTDILMQAPLNTKVVVAFGDSITDGAASGLGTHSSWPDFLAENLVLNNVAVLNAGISGARLLDTRMGENAMARFSRDVLSVLNLKTVIILIGINDIAWPGHPFAPNAPFPTKEQLIAGYRQLIAAAHAHNVRIVAATLTPYKDALKDTPLEGYYTQKGDDLRRQINDWIRLSGEFDAVVDLDKQMASPDDPLAIRNAWQSDHLHFSPKGNKAAADLMTLEILFGK